MLSIFDVQPNVVSRDLKGYSMLIYGLPKTGKTTLASKLPKSLILAFEKGTSAIPGAMAITINSWTDFLKVFRELTSKSTIAKAKEQFENIVIDVADIAYDYCEKYICQQKSVETIGQIPYGARIWNGCKRI